MRVVTRVIEFERVTLIRYNVRSLGSREKQVTNCPGRRERSSECVIGVTKSNCRRRGASLERARRTLFSAERAAEIIRRTVNLIRDELLLSGRHEQPAPGRQRASNCRDPRAARRKITDEISGESCARGQRALTRLALIGKNGRRAGERIKSSPSNRLASQDKSREPTRFE